MRPDRTGSVPAPAWGRPRGPVRRVRTALSATAATAGLVLGGALAGPVAPAGAAPAGVTVCGTALCAGGTSWSSYGATIYNPGLTPYLSGIKNPSGTIALVRQAHLNTIRITNFLSHDGNPATAPYDPTAWQEVDAMIAAAGAAGLHVDLGLSDYRAMLWNSCINPYTANWGQYLSFVANRVNTVTHVVYKDDPTIAFVSLAGEPLPVGTHQFTAVSGQPCTLTYTTAQLNLFYLYGTAGWAHQGGTVLINSGGLSYLDQTSSGIDWRSIFALPNNAFCDIKTYGDMLAWAPTAASYCQSIGKPLEVEEFGWRQKIGDLRRARDYTHMVNHLRALHVAGLAFWNLGYELGPTSYEVSPSTPATFAAVVAGAP